MTFTAKRSFTFPLPFDSGLITHPSIEAAEGDDMVINFVACDAYGDALSLTGATITYGVAQHGYNALLLSGTVTISGENVSVALDADDFISAGGAGEYDGQLRATKDGSSVVMASGRITILPRIE